MSEKKYKLNFIFATDLKYLPMTKLFLPCLLALLITSCHKQKMQLNSDVVSADNQENTYSSKIGSDITYPEVVFKKQYRSKNEYVVILKDENFKNYNNLQIQAEFFTHENSSGLPTGKRMHKPFIFTKELDKSIPTIKSEGVEFESALENLIVDVVLTYMVKGEKVKTDNYSIYVGKDGKAVARDIVEQVAHHEERHDERHGKADDHRRAEFGGDVVLGFVKVVGEGPAHDRHGDPEGELRRRALVGAHQQRAHDGGART